MDDGVPPLPDEPVGRYTPRVGFSLGHIVATPAALDVMHEYKIDLAMLVLRHTRGDWGDLVEEDKQANDQALKTGGRLLSVYGEGERKLWIITEGEDMDGKRQYTTILRPDDY